MPIWNGAQFMDKAIASVVAQTDPRWELLIVDDGSTDDSLLRAQRWQNLVNSHLAEEKIRVFSTGGSNSGMAIGCNLAAQEKNIVLSLIFIKTTSISPGELKAFSFFLIDMILFLLLTKFWRREG